MNILQRNNDMCRLLKRLTHTTCDASLFLGELPFVVSGMPHQLHNVPRLASSTFGAQMVEPLTFFSSTQAVEDTRCFLDVCCSFASWVKGVPRCGTVFCGNSRSIDRFLATNGLCSSAPHMNYGGSMDYGRALEAIEA